MCLVRGEGSAPRGGVPGPGGWCLLLGGVCSWGVCLGGCLLGGVSAPGGLSGGCLLQGSVWGGVCSGGSGHPSMH